MVRFCNKTVIEKGSIYTGHSENAYLKVRIGIIADDENECSSCDLCIGFVTSVRGCDSELRKKTCGNIGICGHLATRTLQHLDTYLYSSPEPTIR